MDGISGLKGWRWIFIIEGLGTLVLAAVSAYLLPADLASARFFTEEEREWASKFYALQTSRNATMLKLS